MTATLWPTFDLACTVSLEVKTSEANEWASQREEAIKAASKIFDTVQGVERVNMDDVEQLALTSSANYRSQALVLTGGQHGELGKRPHHYGFRARFRVKQAA